MVTTRVEDGENYVLFTEGSLPDIQTIKSAYPQRPSFYLQNPCPIFTTREEAAAWMMSAAARRFERCSLLARQYYKPRGDDIFSMRIPYNTWVLGPSKDGKGKLNFWFEGRPQDKDYRLFICRNPLRFEGFNICPAWNLEGIGFTLRHRQYKGTAKFKRQTKEYLYEVLAAYRKGMVHGESVIKRSGHPYWSSSAFPLGSG